MNYWKKMDINKIVENIKNYDYACLFAKVIARLKQ